MIYKSGDLIMTTFDTGSRYYALVICHNKNEISYLEFSVCQPNLGWYRQSSRQDPYWIGHADIQFKVIK